jgi:hypothetical protein
MKGLAVTGTALTFVLAGAAELWPCSCVMPKPVPEALRQTDVVFIGTTTKVERAESLFGLALIIVRHLWAEWLDRDDPYLDKWDESARSGRVAHFRVDEVFKGELASDSVVHTGFGDGDCGYAFEEGVEYVVYANIADDALRPGTQFLRTSICARTAPVGEVPEEPAELRAAAAALR